MSGIPEAVMTNSGLWYRLYLSCFFLARESEIFLQHINLKQQLCAQSDNHTSTKDLMVQLLLAF
jgi:hypothetical protein